MPETRPQKQKLLNVAQNFEVGKEKQLSKARWGIPSSIVDHPQYTKIRYYFEVREVRTVRPTRRRETETGGTEYYTKITSFMRRIPPGDKPRVRRHMQNLINTMKYRELETLLNHVYAHEIMGGPYPFATETDSDVEEITTEKLAEKKQPQKLIWHSASTAADWDYDEDILAWANGKQGGVTAVKEEEGTSMMRYGTDETHGEPFQVLQAHDPFDGMRVVIDTD